MTIRLGLCALWVALVGISGAAQAPETMPYDHIHLAASDPEKAYDWYLANLSGQAGENPGRLIFERFVGSRPLPLQLMFIKAPDSLPSAPIRLFIAPGSPGAAAALANMPDASLRAATTDSRVWRSCLM